MKHSIFAFALMVMSGSVFAQEKISLEQVIALALEKNFDVQIARANSLEASVNNGFAFGGFLPQVNANGSVVLNNNEQSLEFEDADRNNSGTAKSNNISGSVQLVWTLFDGTKMFATRERIAVIKEQGELTLKDTMTNTISSVIKGYFNIVKEKQQLLAIEEQMGVSEERVKLAAKKLEVGTGTKPELLQAKVDYNAFRAQALQQRATIQKAKERLNGLVGEQLTTSFDVMDSIAIDLNLLEENMPNVEESNFGLQASRRNLDVARLSLRERRGELFPTLNFNAAYNYNRVNNVQLINPFAAVFSQTEGFNYGLSVNVPILNGLNKMREVQVAKINFNRQEFNYYKRRANVNISLRNARVDYNNAKEILLVEEENISVAKENVAIALERFRRGNTTFIELRTAQQSLADAYNRLISARYNAKVAETELLRLHGALLK